MAIKKSTKKSLNVKKKFKTPKKSTLPQALAADTSESCLAENSTALSNKHVRDTQEVTPQVDITYINHGYSRWYIPVSFIAGIAFKWALT